MFLQKCPEKNEKKERKVFKDAEIFFEKWIETRVGYMGACKMKTSFPSIHDFRAKQPRLVELAADVSVEGAGRAPVPPQPAQPAAAQSPVAMIA